MMMVMMAETANDMVLNSHADRGRFSREFELVGNLVVYLMGNEWSFLSDGI